VCKSSLYDSAAPGWRAAATPCLHHPACTPTPCPPSAACAPTTTTSPAPPAARTPPRPGWSGCTATCTASWTWTGCSLARSARSRRGWKRAAGRVTDEEMAVILSGAGWSLPPSHPARTAPGSCATGWRSCTGRRRSARSTVHASACTRSTNSVVAPGRHCVQGNPPRRVPHLPRTGRRAGVPPRSHADERVLTGK
jgi:hypothetical protein